MKRKTTITLIVILAMAAAISYAIIWIRNKKTSNVSEANNAASNNMVKDSKTGYQLPAIKGYDWWFKTLGHAKFPLSIGSKGVEVVKVQEVLNVMSTSKNLGALTVDGIWGPKTNDRFNLLFPEYKSGLPQTAFAMYFDANNDIAKLK